MANYLRRWGGPGITTLIGVGFAVIPPIQSWTIAVIAFGAAALWASYLALPKLARFWPGIQTWLPPELFSEEGQAQDARLDAYFAQMEQWLHGPHAPLRQDDSVRVSAQERTIGILPGLSPDGKRRVVRFLHRHALIQVGTAIIALHRADLRKSNLSSLGLPGALITGANLSGADLSDAQFCNFSPTGADLDRAFERGMLQSNLSQPVDVSYLSGSNLRRAVLRRTGLAGCNLRYVDFAKAELDEADLRAADLRHADNLTQKQIESAYGSYNQHGGMEDTLLPPGLKAPKLWERPIGQQKGVRKARSN